MTKVETAAVAERRLQKLLSEKREHEAVLQSGTDRRREFAFAATEGDVDAQLALKAIEDEETAARSALQNIALAVEEARRRVDAARSRERENYRLAEEAATSETRDDLLEVDDDIDDLLIRLREAFQERDTFIGKNDFRLNGVVTSPMNVAVLIQQMLGEWINPGAFQIHKYEERQFVAELDGHKMGGRRSPGVTARPQRPKSALERNLERLSEPSRFYARPAE